MLDIAKRRQIGYWVIAIGLTVGLLYGHGSNWEGSPQLHSVMETAATLLALMAGAMALVRYYSQKESIFLFLGAGFIGTGFLDGYHAIVTSAYFTAMMPSDLPSLIPWSWVASRQYLSILMFLSWIVWAREERLGAAGRFTERTVYVGTAIFTLASFLFFAFAPLPIAYYPGIFFHRPEEFVPALFFLLALIGYLRKGHWRHDIFEHWLILSLIVAFIGQAVFMSHSGKLFDYEFDVAHTLKKVSYICVLTGLLISMYAIFHREEKTALSLKVSEERFRDFAEYGADWFWEMGPEMQFTYIRGGIEDVIGVSPDEMIRKSHEDVYYKAQENESPEWLEYMQCFNNHQPYTDFEMPWVRPDGGLRFISLSGKPRFDADGNFLGYRGVGRDVTKRRLAEEGLEKHRDHLQDLVEERTSELKVAKEAAVEASRAKSEFLSNMSHELRTPLNAILGFAQILEAGKKDKLSKRQKGQIHHIVKGGEHLLKLINDVLDLAKIEAGKISSSIEAIDTRKFIEDFLAIANTLATKRNITIIDRSKDPLPTLWADYLRAKQVILNLISNAVKYNRENGTVWLDVERRDENFLRLRVSDTGLGIPEDKQKDLFQPFQRLGAEATEIEGTGIGLVLAKKLVEEMNGSIGFKSTPGEGSSFWIDLPQVDESTPQEAPEDQNKGNLDLASEGHEKLLLYVEDNPSNLALMESIIEDIPHLKMISAHTAELGIALAEGHNPDVIIFDINLSGMSGIDAVRILKQSFVTKHTPVIALTANAMPRDIKRVHAVGFREYLTKPINISLLTSALQGALKEGAGTDII